MRSGTRGRGWIVVAAISIVALAGCAARDVDATPSALASEVDRCTVGGVSDGCIVPTSNPGVAALAMDAHEVAVTANEVSAHVLDACSTLAHTYGAPLEGAEPTERASKITRACSALAAHLRARTPPVRVEIQEERCFETTRGRCGRTLPDVTCMTTIAVHDDPTLERTSDQWQALVRHLPRKTDEARRLARSVTQRTAVDRSGMSICDATVLSSSQELVEEWSAPLLATEAALTEIAAALARE